jgi:hypothetical protein
MNNELEILCCQNIINATSLNRKVKFHINRKQQVRLQFYISPDTFTASEWYTILSDYQARQYFVTKPTFRIPAPSPSSESMMETYLVSETLVLTQQ